MTYRRFKIALSKGWSVMVCSLTVAVLALMGSCRSKKVNKTEVLPEVDEDTPEVVDEYVSSRAERNLSPTVVLNSDSKAVKDMIEESNTLKESLSRSMNSVIYGPPEVMQRRAAQNDAMRQKIDSLDAAIKKARRK